MNKNLIPLGYYAELDLNRHGTICAMWHNSIGSKPDSENNTVSSTMEEQMQNIKSFVTDLELLSALHEGMS